MTNLTIALVETISDSTHVYSRTPLPRVGIATIGAVLKNMGWPCDIYYKPLSQDDINRLKTYDVVGIGSVSGQGLRATFLHPVFLCRQLVL